MADFNGLYSPNDNQIIINSRTAQGFGDGTYIEVERNKPEQFTTKTGAKGESTFVENLDLSGTIKIHVKQNAAEEHIYYRGLLNSKSIFPIQIVRVVDGYSEKVTVANAMIKVAPRKSMAQDEETRIWEFSCAKILENDTAA